MRGPGADEHRAGRGRCRGPARTRVPAPAAAAGTSSAAARRRAGRARPRSAPRPPRPDGGSQPSSAVRSPSGFQSKTRCGASAVAPSRACSHPSRWSAAAATNTPAAVPFGFGARANARRSTLAKPSSSAGGSSSRTVRICDVGVSRPGSRRASSRSVRGIRERAAAVEEALDEVDLGLRERRVEPDAARRGAVPARDLDDVVACGSGEVRVVEDDLPRARGQRVVERAGDARAASRRARRGSGAGSRGRRARPRSGSCPRRGCP